MSEKHEFKCQPIKDIFKGTKRIFLYFLMARSLILIILNLRSLKKVLRDVHIQSVSENLTEIQFTNALALGKVL